MSANSANNGQKRLDSEEQEFNTSAVEQTSENSSNILSIQHTLKKNAVEKMGLWEALLNYQMQYLQSGENISLKDFHLNRKSLDLFWNDARAQSEMKHFVYKKGWFRPAKEPWYRSDRSMEKVQERTGFRLMEFMEFLKKDGKKRTVVELGQGGGQTMLERKTVLQDSVSVVPAADHNTSGRMETEDAVNDEVSISDAIYWQIDRFLFNILRFDKLGITDEKIQRKLAATIYEIIIFKSFDVATGEAKFDEDLIARLTADPHSIVQILQEKASVIASTTVLPDAESSKTRPKNYNEILLGPKDVPAEFFSVLEQFAKDPQSYIDFGEGRDAIDALDVYLPRATIGKFEGIGNLAKKEFDVSLGVRSTVYVEDENYVKFIYEMSERLTDDGIYMDDNLRKNYGADRGKRLAFLRQLQERFNAEKGEQEPMQMYVIWGPGIETWEPVMIPRFLVMTRSKEMHQHAENFVAPGFRMRLLNEVIKEIPKEMLSDEPQFNQSI